MSIDTLLKQWGDYNISPATRVICLSPAPADAQTPCVSFAWNGIATKDAAPGVARHAAELTLRTFDWLEGRGTTAVTELSSIALITRLANRRISDDDLTHSISVTGAPFISPNGEEEKSCFEAVAPDFVPDEADYSRAVKIERSIMRILMIDPVVKRIAIFGGRRINIQFHAEEDTYSGPDGSKLPFRKVGFNIRDERGMPIQIREETANAIFMIMLRLPGRPRSWGLLQPMTLPRTTWDRDVGLCFTYEMQAILNSPASQLAHAVDFRRELTLGFH